MTTQTPGTEPGRAPACAECGTRAEPGQSFCDACGAVLDWAGTAPSSSSGPDSSAPSSVTPCTAATTWWS
ncbi:hypothetical protein ACWD74_36630, partial [Streptomyces fagopyri]